MARRRLPLLRGSETGSASRYPFAWHKHREISPGTWTVIGDMSLKPGPPLESCALAGCPRPKE